MNSLRKHLSYANVAASLALVFSMSGAAVAANHYLINSTRQINPKVLAKLKGRQGPRGPAGARGATGSVDASNFFSKTESDGRYLGKGQQAADSANLAGVPASGYTTGEGSQGGRWLEMSTKPPNRTSYPCPASASCHSNASPRRSGALPCSSPSRRAAPSS